MRWKRETLHTCIVFLPHLLNCLPRPIFLYPILSPPPSLIPTLSLPTPPLILTSPILHLLSLACTPSSLPGHTQYGDSPRTTRGGCYPPYSEPPTKKVVFISNNEGLRSYHYLQPLHLKYQSLLLPAISLHPPLPPLHLLLPPAHPFPGTGPLCHAPVMVKQNEELYHSLPHQTLHPLHLLKMSGDSARECKHEMLDNFMSHFVHAPQKLHASYISYQPDLVAY